MNNMFIDAFINSNHPFFPITLAIVITTYTWLIVEIVIPNGLAQKQRELECKNKNGILLEHKEVGPICIKQEMIIKL